MAFRIETNAFQPGGNIPANHSKDGGNKSPLIRWVDAPAEAQAFALVVEDPDVTGEPFCHWLVYDIPKDLTQLDPTMLHAGTVENGIHQGMNDFDEMGWGGPQPPQGEKHQYVFRLFALKKPLNAGEGLRRKDLLAKIEDAGVIDRAEITGFYKSVRSRRVSAA